MAQSHDAHSEPAAGLPHARGHDNAHRPASVSSGNPRITVAFPFSKIEIAEPPAGLSELAVLVSQLAGQVATVVRAATPAAAHEADLLAAQAAALAQRLAAGR